MFSSPFLKIFDFVSLLSPSLLAAYNQSFSEEGKYLRPSINTFFDSSGFYTLDSYIQRSSQSGKASIPLRSNSLHYLNFPSIY